MDYLLLFHIAKRVMNLQCSCVRSRFQITTLNMMAVISVIGKIKEGSECKYKSYLIFGTFLLILKD